MEQQSQNIFKDFKVTREKRAVRRKDSYTGQGSWLTAVSMRSTGFSLVLLLIHYRVIFRTATINLLLLHPYGPLCQVLS